MKTLTAIFQVEVHTMRSVFMRTSFKNISRAFGHVQNTYAHACVEYHRFCRSTVYGACTDSSKNFSSESDVNDVTYRKNRRDDHQTSETKSQQQNYFSLAKQQRSSDSGRGKPNSQLNNSHHFSTNEML